MTSNLQSSAPGRVAGDTAAGSALRAILPIVAAVFVAFLLVGMSVLVIPLHVHSVLGYGPLVVGTIVGAQFIASLLSRPWAGTIADANGPKAAVMTGFVAASASGVFYLASLAVLEAELLEWKRPEFASVDGYDARETREWLTAFRGER